MRFATGLLSGVAVGLLASMGVIATTDKKTRRRMMRDSKRAVRRAGHYVHDILD